MMKKRYLLSVLIAVIITVGTASTWIYYNRIPSKVTVTVDFADKLYFTGHDGDKEVRTVLPVYNTLNIWDIDWFINPDNNASEYRRKFYFIDRW